MYRNPICLILAFFMLTGLAFGFVDQPSDIFAQQSDTNEILIFDQWIYLPVVAKDAPPCPFDQQIAFVSLQGINWQHIGLVCSDGSFLRELELLPYPVTWSPDKSQFAFIPHYEQDDIIQIYDLFCGCIVQTITVPLIPAYNLAWSPNGEKFAFTSSNAIYVINFDGTGLVRLTDPTEYAGGASWSPDGTKIVYGAQDGAEIVIRIREISGLGYLEFAFPGWSVAPSWSPNGNQIAFMSSQNNTWDLYLMNDDGTGLTQLTNMPTNENFPSWSSDGTQIVFSVYEDYQEDLYIINSDGTGLRLLASDGTLPSWGD